MDLSFSDEQQFLREAVRGAVDRHASFAQVREWVLGDTIDAAPAFELATGQGWTGIGIPEEQGGQGGGLLELAILAEELGRGAVPADALYGSLLAALTLAGCGDGDGDGRVAALAEGELTGALLASADAPCDPHESAPDEIAMVLGAPGAGILVAPETERVSVYEAAAVSVEERRLVDRTRNLGRVTVAGEPAATIAAGAPSLAAHAAVIVAADALGASQRLLDLTVEYVADRVQFKVPVGSFQAVKHTAAEMLVAIEGLRGTVHYAAWAVGEGEPGAETDAWVAKARACRAASFVADKALFLHGAVGYTWEHDLQLLFKRAKSDAALFGGAGAYDARIAGALALDPAPQPA